MTTRLDDILSNVLSPGIGLAKILKTKFRHTDEPQRSYTWEIKVFGGDEPFQYMTLYAKTASIPADSSDTIEEKYVGVKVQYPGPNSSENKLTLTFWDDQSLAIYKYFQSWYNKTHHPETGEAVSKSGVIRTVQLSLKDSSDLFETAQVNFFNCFPTEVGEVQLSYEGSDVIEVSVTLAFDWKQVGEYK